MKDVRATLIKLFSSHLCEEIEASCDLLTEAFDAPTYAAVVALPGYAEEYNRVKTAKHQIERIEQTFTQHDGDQALQSLCLLKTLRAATTYRSPNYDIARTLIDTTLYVRWSEPDRKLFDQRARVFDAWTDFFISYTNRDANSVNNRYKQLIMKELGWPPAKQVQRRNYVARVLAKFLEQEGIRCFIDFKGLQCGDELKEAIVGHCQSAVAFVQLVEREALREPAPPSVNWCHLEYVSFAGACLPAQACTVSGNRRFFVKAGDLLEAPAAAAATYGDWFADLFDPERSKLAIIMDDYAKAPFDDLRTQLRGVAKQILVARTELIETMLSSWN